jgi:2-iminobutanoate/2-iminopropanoate deaminase
MKSAVMLPVFLTAVLAGCAAKSPAIAPRCFHLNASVENDIGYCQALRVGKALFISGSVGKGDMAAAMRGAYEELKSTLDAHGLSFKNVVKETVFTTNLDEFIGNKAVRKEFYTDAYPSASWVQVQRLYSPAYVVEIELEAVFP